MQHRFDLSFVKNTKFTEKFSLELGFDLFNIFDTVNLATPNNDLQDTADFGKITQTTGGSESRTVPGKIQVLNLSEIKG